jgi:hypothetical protein
MAEPAAGYADLANARAAFDVAGAAQRLNLLDDLWTSYAETRDPGREPFTKDRDALYALVADMQVQLESLQGNLPMLQSLVEQVGAEAIGRTVEALIAESPQREEVQAAMSRLLGDQSFADVAVDTCQYVAAHASEEAGDLQKQLDAMFDDYAVAGDLKLSFKCKLTLVGAVGLVVGGTILGALAGLPLGVPLLSALGGAAVGFGGAIIAVASNCPELMREPAAATSG